MTGRHGRLGLEPFLRDLSAHLAKVPREDLERLVQSWAKEIPPEERAEFIGEVRERTRPPAQPRRGKPRGAAHPKQSPKGDPRLLKDIKQLREALANAEYSNGWGWDDEIGEEREWGDESWATEMDGLFGRAQAVFEEGDFRLARDALGALMECLEMDQDGEGHFPGRQEPEEMLDTDVREARAMYLRAIYETERPAARPGAILEACRGAAFSRDIEGVVQAMLECREQRPHDEAQFLEAWEAHLRKRAKVPGTATLLREVVKLRGGAKGLKDLAAGPGRRDAAVWRELADAMGKEGDARAAAAAREEGAAKVRNPEERADLLDAAAATYHQLRDRSSVERCVTGALAAWPDFARLAAAWGLGKGKGAAAISAALALRGEGWDERPDARAAALTLAGRFEEAVELARRAGSHGWTTGHNPQALVVPMGFLYAAHGDAAKSPTNVVSAFANAMAHAHDRGSGSAPKVLIRGLEAASPPPAEAAALLPALVAMAVARADTIVGEGRSGHYADAAKVLAAGAEAVALRLGRAEAEELLARVVASHGAAWGFRQQVRRACQRSWLLKPLEWEGKAREMRSAARSRE